MKTSVYPKGTKPEIAEEVDAAPTAAELEAEGQNVMFQRKPLAPEDVDALVSQMAENARDGVS